MNQTQCLNSVLQGNPHLTFVSAKVWQTNLQNITQCFLILKSISGENSTFSSYNGYKLNSHLTCFQRSFLAKLVEHRTGIAEVMGLNHVEASEFFLSLSYTHHESTLWKCNRFHVHTVHLPWAGGLQELCYIVQFIDRLR